MTMHTFEEYDFAVLARSEPNPRVRIRLIMMNQFKANMKSEQVAENLALSVQTVKRRYKRYLEKGLSALKDKPRTW